MHKKSQDEYQPRPQGFSLKKWVGKALGTRLDEYAYCFQKVSKM